MLLWIFILASGISLHAQVTIGAEGDDPEDFIALKLVSTTSGLRYPQLSGTQITTLNGTIGTNSLAQGLVVFNTDGTGSLQYYVGGNKWVNLSAIRGVAKSAAEEPVQFAGNANVNVNNIVSNNYIEEYSIQLPANRNIELIKVGKYLDYENIIKSISFDAESSTGSYKVEVEFYPKIKDLLQTDNEGSISVRLYAKYIDGGIEKQTDFTIQVANIE
jgi:hypothetical protein